MENRTAQWMKTIKSSGKYGHNAERAVAMLHSEKKQKNICEDTKLRNELHARIKKQVQEGKSILEIVKDLNSVDTYQKYSMYFEHWILDQMEKIKKENNRLVKKEMER